MILLLFTLFVVKVIFVFYDFPVYDEIDERLRSLNKSDVTYHISDLKKNEEPESTPSSVKIKLSEFSSPFEVGPHPSTVYLPISGFLVAFVYLASLMKCWSVV